MVLRNKHELTRKMFKVLLEKKFNGTYINHIFRKGDIIYANVRLPEHKDLDNLLKILPNLQQEFKATAVRLGKQSGKDIEIVFGMNALTKVDFSNDLLIPNTIKVQFPSAYGSHHLDFEDGSSCHLLNGGVTRMGKTCFLLYVATTVFLQMQGEIQLYISSAKLKDYYPFQNIPQVRMERTVEGMNDMLDEIIEEYKKRDKLLYSSEFRKATDAKGIRKLYPSAYHLFKPVFLIIDEYARFAEDKSIQEKVTEIVETAGFVNVHVIIASQRPDASTVLKPRIRANLLARMAFTTVDKKNSEIILDREGAEKLGKIAGRGLLIDSDSHIIQVPYLDPVECDSLLEPYRKEVVEDEQIEEGCPDTTVVDKIQSMLKESISLDGLQEEFPSSKRDKPSHEKNVNGWFRLASPEGER